MRWQKPQQLKNSKSSREMCALFFFFLPFTISTLFYCFEKGSIRSHIILGKRWIGTILFGELFVSAIRHLSIVFCIHLSETNGRLCENEHLKYLWKNPHSNSIPTGYFLMTMHFSWQVEWLKRIICFVYSDSIEKWLSHLQHNRIYHVNCGTLTKQHNENRQNEMTISIRAVEVKIISYFDL